ncbi:MAG TPA: sigma-70 family RNA polymerase sigma factor, partial [Planctomycetota bacterium]
MTSAHTNARLEEWLRHEGFLRRTLRGLLASEADVDDVLQQTWTKLLERPAAAPGEPRRWLVRVARNVALGGLRARRRRSEHEAEALPRAAGDSPAESAARVEALQQVGAAILALAEPYRSVVLLRHEQELDVATIARRLGRSEATVRSQLARAHELLRQRLDREFGGRERWALLAAPLVSAAPAWLVPGAAALLLLAAAAAYVVWPEAEPERAEVASARAAELLATPPASTSGVVAREEQADPQRVPARTLPAHAPAAPTPFEILLQGRVGDASTGGNVHRVHADGQLDRFRELVAEPLSIDLTLQAGERLAHVTAATLPADHVLHVYHVEFAA